MQAILGVASWLGAAIIGAILSLLLNYWLENRLSGAVYFFVRRLKLRFEKDIALAARVSATISGAELLATTNQRILQQHRDSLLASLRLSFNEVSLRGESVITGSSSRDPAIRFSAELEPISVEDLDGGDATLTFTVETRADYRSLIEHLFGLVNELEMLKSSASPMAPQPRFLPGKAAVTVRFRRAPTVLTVLSKLAISELHTERDNYKIDLGASGVTFRGELTRELASSVREVVTWYY